VRGGCHRELDEVIRLPKQIAAKRSVQTSTGCPLKVNWPILKPGVGTVLLFVTVVTNRCRS
jgi:hypothetical protein